MVKYSKQRELIYQAVRENLVHPTADFIYNKLKEENPGLSLGTVYRNLNQLAEDGKIRKLKMAGGPDRFDGTLHPHYHMVCRSCGELVDIQCEALEGLTQKAAEESGIQVEGFQILFEGICSDCVKGRSN